MSEYLNRDDVLEVFNDIHPLDYNAQAYLAEIEELPIVDVVEVRQIRAFIDRLVAERDKYDLHSMRWEHYDCDRLLIERMLDEMDGGEEAQREGERE